MLLRSGNVEQWLLFSSNFETNFYIFQYTPEEIDWYGYTYKEALKKLQAQLRAENVVIPHKVEFRMKLIEQLKQAGIREAGGVVDSTEKSSSSTDKDSDIEALTKLYVDIFYLFICVS